MKRHGAEFMKTGCKLLCALLIALTASISPRISYAATAAFAGGCFWCMEQAFEELEGVSEAVSGFTGGTLKNPTYNGDHRGHYEAIRIDYDPNRVSYDTLLKHYWRNIDPFDDRGQFCDKGFSYRAAIFTANPDEQARASVSLAGVQESFADATVVTQILPANTFWPVEEYHQDYYLKNPLRYRYYKSRCGRSKRLQELWGDK